MSRRRARSTSTFVERYLPRWPIATAAVALLLAVTAGGYAVGRAATGGGEAVEPELGAVSGIFVQPPGAPSEQAVEPEEDAEPDEEGHPAGIDPENVYVLQNADGDRVVDVAEAATANGARIHLWDRHDAEHQQWRFVPVDGGHYELEGVASDKLLQIPTGEDDDPGAVILTRTGSPNQHWQVVEAGDGTVRLLNRETGQALEGQGGGTEDGTPVAHGPDEGHPHQQWRLLPLDPSDEDQDHQDHEDQDHEDQDQGHEGRAHGDGGE